jgi:hypothetical protein
MVASPKDSATVATIRQARTIRYFMKIETGKSFLQQTLQLVSSALAEAKAGWAKARTETG